MRQDHHPDEHRKRRRTYDLPGHAHELTFSCSGRQPLLSKDRTRQWLIDALNAARQKWGFELWAYVIMPEHAHALVYPPDKPYSIAAFLKSVKQPVARQATNFLRKEAPEFLKKLRAVRPDGRVEHRFWLQGGGYDRNMMSPAAVRSAIEYLHNNPVRRGLVGSAHEWKWSSARWYAGLPDVPLQIDRPDFG